MPVTAPSQNRASKWASQMPNHPTGETQNHPNSIIVTEETMCCPCFPKCFIVTSFIYSLRQDFVFTM